MATENARNQQPPDTVFVDHLAADHAYVLLSYSGCSPIGNQDNFNNENSEVSSGYVH